MSRINLLNGIQRAVLIARGETYGNATDICRALAPALDQAHSENIISKKVDELAKTLASSQSTPIASSTLSKLAMSTPVQKDFAERVEVIFLKSHIHAENFKDHLDTVKRTNNTILLKALTQKATELPKGAISKGQFHTLLTCVLKSDLSAEKQVCLCKSIFKEMDYRAIPFSQTEHEILLTHAIENKRTQEVIELLLSNNNLLSNRIYLRTLSQLLKQFIANSNKANHNLASSFASRAKAKETHLLSKDSLDRKVIEAVKNYPLFLGELQKASLSVRRIFIPHQPGESIEGRIYG